MKHAIPTLLLAACASLAWAGEAPNGTTFEHKVLSVDGPNLVRIQFCGLPVQISLAGISYKTPQWEEKGLAYLKSTLRPGQTVRIDTDFSTVPQDTFPAPAFILAGGKNCNVELVRQGIAVTDARSKQHGKALQTAMMEATKRKAGFWGVKPTTTTVAAKRPPKPARPTRPVTTAKVKPTAPKPVKAPPGYSGVVVADLNGGEYFYPGSRLARTIRPGARIEYKSPDAAERANPRPKRPNPYDFPDLFDKWKTKQLADKKITLPAPDKAVADSRQALKEATTLMQEGYKNRSKFNTNLKKAEKILAAQLQIMEPLAEARPNDPAVQKVAESLAMQLYQARKNQSL
jgi:hypothetical protein